MRPVPRCATPLTTWLQFLRELHFIEAFVHFHAQLEKERCSSFGSCTSLRPSGGFGSLIRKVLQFLRELHFIEAGQGW